MDSSGIMPVMNMGSDGIGGGNALLMFDAEILVYSLIFNFVYATVQDRVHKQSINVQALIFTKNTDGSVSKFIIEKLARTVTYWDGVGAYTNSPVRVLCVYLSKYEVEELIRTGRLNEITAWLCDKIHRHSALYKPGKLFEMVCGKFDPKFYTDYLKEKYTKLYEL